MNKVGKITIFVFIFLFFTQRASALVINEVMYDLDGTDTDREWIEIYNDGGSSLDIEGYKFFEANSNHTLTIYSGSYVLPAGSYAVICQKPETFLSDWPGFTGTLIDSSFSLSNESGEYLEIRDSNLATVATLSYDPSIGAAGDGNSLNRNGSSWIAASPSPGSSNNTSSNSSNDNTDNTTTTTTTTASSSSGSPTSSGETVQKQSSWSITFSMPSSGYVGDEIEIEGIVKNLFLERIRSGFFFWNMGDGSVYEGEKLSEITHTYKYPGDYIIVLEYWRNGSFEPEVIARKNITIENSSIKISPISSPNGTSIKIENSGKGEIDLGGWEVMLVGSSYILPKNTIILPSKTITLMPEQTGFTFVGNSLSLMAPDHTLASTYSTQPVTSYAYSSGGGSTGISRAVSYGGDSDVDVLPRASFTDEESSNLSANVIDSGISKNTSVYAFFVIFLFLVSLGYLYIRRTSFAKAGEDIEDTAPEEEEDGYDFKLLE
ncbi:MAG: lamin tail domain-containing protein [Candidatus Nomurabacteria bacterium]|nr:MAG: lamin tail domain-containing protein [Candidatus Nomurabacteria bacterium]